MTQAKRGFVPDDVRNFSMDGIAKMRTASQDIRYLINHGYDLKSATTYVGNHFLLSERQRMALMRSVCTDEQLENRKKKELSAKDLRDQEVWIDGFNQIITLEVLCSHSVLLSCMDGCIRDLASLRGSYRLITETDEAISLLLGELKEMHVSECHILLDEPVSNSGRLKTRIAEINEQQYVMHTDIQILKNVDRTLYDKENVITSDSIILDHCKSWFNLSSICVRNQNMKTYRVYQ